MFSKIKEIEERYDEFESQMASPDLIQNQSAYQKVAKEHSQLAPIITAFRKYQSVQEEIEGNNSLLEDIDPEIRKLAKEELDILNAELESLEKELKVLLLPKDPNDEKNILLEIRAGTGGEEAALFAADLFKMYCRYAELKRWKTEILSQSVTGIGGFKEIILLVEGQKVYSRLKYESGVHRVQRVPETETQGRIHTSAVTVAVLPHRRGEKRVLLQPKRPRLLEQRFELGVLRSGERREGGNENGRQSGVSHEADHSMPSEDSRTSVG